MSIQGPRNVTTSHHATDFTQEIEEGGVYQKAASEPGWKRKETGDTAVIFLKRSEGAKFAQIFLLYWAALLSVSAITWGRETLVFKLLTNWQVGYGR